MIRHLSDEHQSVVLALFNRIWLSHTFPDSWRIATVIPIRKPGKDPTNPSNYRPIALTSCLCKIMERMVCFRLVSFWKKIILFQIFSVGLDVTGQHWTT